MRVAFLPNNIGSKWSKWISGARGMTIYRDERGLSQAFSDFVALLFFASFFGCLSEPPFFPKWGPKASQSDYKTFPNWSHKRAPKSPKAHFQFSQHFLILLVNFLTWLCAANIVNTVSKPLFALAHAVKEKLQKTFPKPIKFTLKTTPKSVPNLIWTKNQKKRSNKSSKVWKNTQNVAKWGPKRRVMEVIFRHFWA